MTEGISIWFWVGFNAFVLAMLALDLGVFHRKAHEIKFKEAAGWSVFWITLAFVFNGLLLWQWHNIQPNSAYTNSEAALSFLTGYLIEKSLSVDNLFVILLIFGYFAVPAIHQHRVLFWGILGALVFRAVFIFAGVALITKFAWMVVVFGGFLIALPVAIDSGGTLLHESSLARPARAYCRCPGSWPQARPHRHPL